LDKYFVFAVNFFIIKSARVQWGMMGIETGTNQ